MKGHARKQRWLVPAIALLLVLVASLASGCGADARQRSASSGETPTEDFDTSEDVKAEYEAARNSFGADFPPNVELPFLADQIDGLVENEDGQVFFENGYGESQLVTVWRCAWQRSFLNAVNAGDKKAEARAADELSRHYYEIDAVKKWVHDPDKLWDRDVIQPALQGDVGPLEQDLTVSCGKPFAP